MRLTAAWARAGPDSNAGQDAARAAGLPAQVAFGTEVHSVGWTSIGTAAIPTWCYGTLLAEGRPPASRETLPWFRSHAAGLPSPVRSTALPARPKSPPKTSIHGNHSKSRATL
jgi:hypothetical protein